MAELKDISKVPESPTDQNYDITYKYNVMVEFYEIFNNIKEFSDYINEKAINGIFDAELVAITMCGITKHKKNYEEIKKKLISTGQYSSILQCITNIELVIRNIEDLVTKFIALTVLEGLKKKLNYTNTL